MGKRSRTPGPYGTYEEDAQGKLVRILTEEGQRLLTAWLQEWPKPVKLYAKVFPREYHWVRTSCRIDNEELNAAALVGCTAAMWSWDPERATFTTTAGYHIRAAIQRLTSIPDNEKQIYYGVTVLSADAPIKRRSTDDGNFNLMKMIGKHDATDHDQDSLHAEIQTALRRQVPCPRQRAMFNLYHGLLDGCPRTLDEVAAVYGVTRERVRQINKKTIHKIYPDLFGMHRKYVEAAV